MRRKCLQVCMSRNYCQTSWLLVFHHLSFENRSSPALLLTAGGRGGGGGGGISWFLVFFSWTKDTFFFSWQIFVIFWPLLHYGQSFEPEESKCDSINKGDNQIFHLHCTFGPMWKVIMSAEIIEGKVRATNWAEESITDMSCRIPVEFSFIAQLIMKSFFCSNVCYWVNFNNYWPMGN